MVQLIDIESLDTPGLAPYVHLNESQLKHYFEPEAGIFIAESPNAILRALAAGYEPLSVLMERRYVSTEGAAILEALGGPAGTSKSRGTVPGTVGLSADDSAPEQGSPAVGNPASGAGRAVIPVYVSTLDVLCSITGYHLTRGILAAFRRKSLPSVEEVCRDARRIAVLENIENPTNVGAIIRSAAALEMDAVLLTPQCADPLQRRAIRVSVGTVFQVPWTWIGLPERHYTWMKKRGSDGLTDRSRTELAPAERAADSGEAEMSGIRAENGMDAGSSDAPAGAARMRGDGVDTLPSWPDAGMAQLRRLGFRTVSMALDERATRIDDPALAAQEKLALLLGNEGDGLLPQTLALSDDVVTIPMQHGVDSLNAAAAAAVAFWQLRPDRGEN